MRSWRHERRGRRATTIQIRKGQAPANLRVRSSASGFVPEIHERSAVCPPGRHRQLEHAGDTWDCRVVQNQDGPLTRRRDDRNSASHRAGLVGPPGHMLGLRASSSRISRLPTLMISLGVVMRHEFTDGAPQRRLADEDHANVAPSPWRSAPSIRSSQSARADTKYCVPARLGSAATRGSRSPRVDRRCASPPSGPWRFRKILRPTASNGPQVGGEVAKRGAQAFLEHRVIERHRQRGLDRHVRLCTAHASRCAMCSMPGSKHLGAQQPATRAGRRKSERGPGSGRRTRARP